LHAGSIPARASIHFTCPNDCLCRYQAPADYQFQSVVRNLALDPEHRKMALRLNAMTNALIKREVGVDNGQEYPGPTEMYNRGRFGNRAQPYLL
jgi:hypothetical protein